VGSARRSLTSWGYVRIVGELRKLGINVSATLVRSVLVDAGIPPAPQRDRQSWRAFLRQQGDSILACDFLTVDTVWLRLWVPKLGSRRGKSGICRQDVSFGTPHGSQRQALPSISQRGRSDQAASARCSAGTSAAWEAAHRTGRTGFPECGLGVCSMGDGLPTARSLSSGGYWGSGRVSAARSELVACCGASDRSPDQPAPAQSERGKHVFATGAPHLGRGSGPVVRLSLG
jgi:hypothetical protein